MKVLEIIKVSLKNIFSNKLRSGLTMLGLIIGIASVIVLVGIGTGATNDVSSQVQSLGTDILTATINSSDVSLEYSQMDEIEELSNVESVAPYKAVSATVSRNTTSSSKSSIIATNDSYLNVTNMMLAKGRTISVIDIENNSKVCILGAEIATDLFSLTDPVGETVKIDGDNYTVIGLLKEAGTSMGTDVDNTILIPITTAKYLGSDTTINNIYIKVEDENKIDITTTLIENYLRSTLQISSDYYSVSSQDSMLNAMEDINSTLSLLLGGIAGISLIVGGIGVMNVMLVSVTERTKEIGIRKSLGAKKKDILLQFLVEALVLSLLGGIIGIGTGLLIGNIVTTFGYTFTPSTTIILISFGSSAFIRISIWDIPIIQSCLSKPNRSIKNRINPHIMDEGKMCER